MTELKIVLKDDKGSPTTYTQEHVPGTKYLAYWDMMIEIDKEQMLINEAVAKRVQFVADLFDSESVTAERILNEIDAWDLLDTLDEIIDTMQGLRKDSDPKPE